MRHVANGSRRTRTALLAGALGCGAAMALAAMMFVVAPRPAAATPSYAQQTGLSCGKCHAGPAGGKLNGFGQKFQENGHKLPGK